MPDVDGPDADAPWTWADDEGWTVEVPATSAAVLRDVTDDSAGLARGLRVDVHSEDGSVEPWSDARLEALSTESADQVRRLLEGPVTIDEDGLAALTAASQALAVLCRLRFEAPGDGVDRSVEDLLRWAAETERLHRELTEALMRRIRARRDGRFRVVLDDVEQRLIDEGLAELDSALGSDDPALQRLLPTAYPDDEERQAGWAALVHGELIERRRVSIARARALLGRRLLDADELSTLMRCLNDLRLVLGTRLDVSEDGWPAGGIPDEDQLAAALYEHLGMMVAEIVLALRTAL